LEAMTAANRGRLRRISDNNGVGSVATVANRSGASCPRWGCRAPAWCSGLLLLWRHGEHMRRREERCTPWRLEGKGEEGPEATW
jgi:hypothetical protein